MCLAIFKPAGKEIPEDHLKEGWRHNPHGAGFAYTQSGLVKIAKGFMSYGKFLKAYKKRVRKSASALVHFRWATVGAKTHANCHPFRLSESHAMIHNGHLSGIAIKNGGSDTNNFAKRILGPIVRQHPNFIHTTHGRKIVNLAIGSSKVVVLTGTGASVIFNEHKGVWDDKIWYSNDQYKRVSASIAPSRPTATKTKTETYHKPYQTQLHMDYHASNRGNGRSYIDDLEDEMSAKKYLENQAANHTRSNPDRCPFTHFPVTDSGVMDYTDGNLIEGGEVHNGFEMTDE
jgi:hypothetical protein